MSWFVRFQPDGTTKLNSLLRLVTEPDCGDVRAEGLGAAVVCAALLDPKGVCVALTSAEFAPELHAVKEAETARAVAKVPERRRRKRMPISLGSSPFLVGEARRRRERRHPGADRATPQQVDDGDSDDA